MQTGKRIKRFFVMLTLFAGLMIPPVSSFAMTGEEILESYNSGAPSEDDAEENYDAAKQQMEQIYYNALEEISKDEGPFDMPFPQWLYVRFYRLFFRLKEAAPYICVLSEFFGIVIVAMSNKNKRIQKKALIFLNIGIPLATILFLFAVGTSPLFKR